MARQRKFSTQEEVIAALQECARKLGRAPNYPELRRMKKMSHVDYRKYFGTLAAALKAAGLEPRGGGHRIEMPQLFEDWALVARKVGRCPSAPDYEVHSKYSLQPLQRRFGAWANVSLGMRDYAEKQGLKENWADVMAMITRLRKESPEGRRPSARKGSEAQVTNVSVLPNRTLYGAPLGPPGMQNAPVNEDGVILLFGMLAVRLRFSIIHVQGAYPECQAWREVEPGRWQWVNIEFEFRARNFLAHGHDPAKCDLIVCWENDWEDCPVEVLELKKYL